MKPWIDPQTDRRPLSCGALSGFLIVRMRHGASPIFPTEVPAETLPAPLSVPLCLSASGLPVSFLGISHGKLLFSSSIAGIHAGALEHGVRRRLVSGLRPIGDADLPPPSASAPP